MAQRRRHRLVRVGCAIGALAFVLTAAISVGGGETNDVCAAGLPVATTYPFNSC